MPRRMTGRGRGYRGRAPGHSPTKPARRPTDTLAMDTAAPIKAQPPWPSYQEDEMTLLLDFCRGK